MNDVHNPKRMPDETFDDYKKRRKLSSLLVNKNHKFSHVSSYIAAKTIKVYDKNTNQYEEHPEKDDDGNTIYERRTQTYVKPKRKD